MPLDLSEDAPIGRIIDVVRGPGLGVIVRFSNLAPQYQKALLAAQGMADALDPEPLNCDPENECHSDCLDVHADDEMCAREEALDAWREATEEEA